MRVRTVCLLIALLLLPGVAVADVGTPLLWGNSFHLLLGNILVGLFEAAVLARMFKLPFRRSAAWLIVGNYLSSWVGFFGLGRLERVVQPDLYGGWRFGLAMVAATYLATLVLEWPFVALAVRGSPGWLRRSTTGSLVVQTASYLILFGAYALVSSTSLYTRTTLASPGELPLPPGVQVYYFGAGGTDVYRLVGGAPPVRVLAFRSTDRRDSLRFQRSPGDSLAWDLVAVHASEPPAEIARVAATAVVRAPRDSVWNSSLYSAAVPRIGSAVESAWRFRASPWSTEGLRATNHVTGERLHLAFGTPLIGWAIWQGIHLPGDRLLFMLGEDQICLLDVATRRVALLGRGSGIVALVGSS